MVNYACAFSQPESGKYFEWIININSATFKLCISYTTLKKTTQNDNHDGHLNDEYL